VTSSFAVFQAVIRVKYQGDTIMFENQKKGENM